MKIYLGSFGYSSFPAPQPYPWALGHNLRGGHLSLGHPSSFHQFPSEGKPPVQEPSRYQLVIGEPALFGWGLEEGQQTAEFRTILVVRARPKEGNNVSKRGSWGQNIILKDFITLFQMVLYGP